MKHISWLFLISLFVGACVNDTPCADGKAMPVANKDLDAQTAQNIEHLEAQVNQQFRLIDSLRSSLRLAHDQLDSLSKATRAMQVKSKPFIHHAHGDPIETRTNPALTPDLLLRQRQKEDSIQDLLRQIQRIRDSK